MNCMRCHKPNVEEEPLHSAVRINTLGSTNEMCLCSDCSSELIEFMRTPQSFNLNVDENDETENTRSNFIANLGILLRQTREHVSCIVHRIPPNGVGEFADIVYRNGYIKSVNISMDSYAAIIRDVMKVVG